MLIKKTSECTKKPKWIKDYGKVFTALQLLAPYAASRTTKIIKSHHIGSLKKLN